MHTPALLAMKRSFFLNPSVCVLGYRTLCSTSLRHDHASLSPVLPASFSPLLFVTSPLLDGNSFALQ